MSTAAHVRQPCGRPVSAAAGGQPGSQRAAYLCLPEAVTRRASGSSTGSERVADGDRACATEMDTRPLQSKGGEAATPAGKRGHATALHLSATAPI